MEKLRVVLLAVVGLSFLLFGGATAGHYATCSGRWVSRNSSCYLLNTTKLNQDDATGVCKSLNASLAAIESEIENEFLEKAVEAEETWIGARYIQRDYSWKWQDRQGYPVNYVRYKNFDLYGRSSRDNPCSSLTKWGYWREMSCFESLPFLCEKRSDCKAGWYGDDCAFQCHCYQNDACGRSTGLCPRGCSKGWSGPECNNENAEPVASYHCMRTLNDELRAQLTLSHQGRQFPLVKAVGQDNKPLACSGDRMSVKSLAGSLIFVNLRLPGAFDGGNATDDVSSNVTATDDVSGNVTATDDVSGNVTFAGFLGAADRDDCIASWSTNGTVTWLIEFSRYESLTIGNDVTVEVTCDLHDAIDLEEEHSLEDDSASDVALDPQETPLNISVALIDDFTGDDVERLHTGQQLRLVVRVEGLNKDECVYPRSCVARAKDGSADDQGVKLVDDKGCPVAGSPVNTFEVSSSTLKSNSFPAFTLGSDSVDIDCQVDIITKMAINTDCPKPNCP